MCRAPEELLGRRFSQYTVIGVIGLGQTGRVYRALDERDHREVALKVLTKNVLYMPKVKEALQKRVRVLARLGHPNVAAAYEVGTSAGGHDFIASELVAGQTLAEILSQGPVSSSEIVRIGMQIACGLDAAHAYTLVHGSLDPQKIMVAPDGEVKILGFARPVRTGGFDLRRAPEGTIDVTSAAALPYVPPERLRGEAVDVRSDVFGTGTILYEMATGRPPFSHGQLAVLLDVLMNHNPLPPSVLNPLVPMTLEQVILKALRKSPDHRQQSASELLCDIRWVERLGDADQRTRCTGARKWWGLLAGGPHPEALRH